MTQRAIEQPLRADAPAISIAPGETMARWLRALAIQFVPPAAALALIALAWEIYVRVRDVPEYLVPPPTTIARRLAEDPSFFAREGWVTLSGAALGFGIGAGIAIALAIVMAHSRPLERALFPLAILVKVTPIVALAPLLAIWFGFGLTPRLFIVSLITFFPVMVNAIVGFRSVNSDALALMRSLAASRAQIFLKLRLPSSLPYLFAAFRVAAPLSVIGAVVAEWFAGSRGLGHTVQTANNNIDMPTAFAAIASLAMLGIMMYLAIAAVEARLLRWHESELREQ